MFNMLACYKDKDKNYVFLFLLMASFITFK